MQPCYHTNDPEMYSKTQSRKEPAYSWCSAWKWWKHGSCQSIRSYKHSCGHWWDLTPRSQLPSLLLTFPPCTSRAIFIPAVTGHPERHKESSSNKRSLGICMYWVSSIKTEAESTVKAEAFHTLQIYRNKTCFFVFLELKQKLQSFQNTKTFDRICYNHTAQVSHYKKTH